jgi:hypothetical protein
MTFPKTRNSLGQAHTSQLSRFVPDCPGLSRFIFYDLDSRLNNPARASFNLQVAMTHSTKFDQIRANSTSFLNHFPFGRFPHLDQSRLIFEGRAKTHEFNHFRIAQTAPSAVKPVKASQAWSNQKKRGGSLRIFKPSKTTLNLQLSTCNLQLPANSLIQ